MLGNILKKFLSDQSVKKIYVSVNSMEMTSPVRSPKISYLVAGRTTKSLVSKLYAALTSKFWIWGGGTCIYGIADNPGLLNLYKWVQFSRLIFKKFIFLGIGIGRLDQKGRSIAKKLLLKSAKVSFRDKQSIDLANDIIGEINNPSLSLTGDMFFLMDNSRQFEILKKSNIIKKIGIAGVHYYKDNDILVSKMAHMVQRLLDQSIQVSFIALHKGKRNDDDFHRCIIGNRDLLHNHKIIFENYQSIEELFNIYRRLDFTINFRLHSVVISDHFHIPNLAFPYSPKIEAYINKAGINFNSRLINNIDEVDLKLCNEVMLDYNQKKEAINDFIKAEVILANAGIHDTLSYCKSH